MKPWLKWVSLALALILIACIGFVFNMFTGNPISAWLSQRVMEQYLSETYPGKNFTIQQVSYDFKFGRYQARVIEGENVSFVLAGSPDRIQYDQYRYSYAMDQTLTERFSQQFAQEMETLLKPQFSAFEGVHAEIYVAKDTLPADAQFVKGMEQSTAVEIFMVGDPIPAGDFVQLVSQVRDTLLENGYQPEALGVLYNEPGSADAKDKSGPLLYRLDLKKGQINLPESEMLAGVRVFNQ